MPKLLVKEGKHYHQVPPLSTLPWIGEQSMERSVIFHESCAQELPSYHGDNVNKLFGLSFGFGGVHDDSARFGWRWSKRLQLIELLAYCYINGDRNWDEQLRFPVVAQVQIGKAVKCGIEYIKGPHEGIFYFTVNNSELDMLSTAHVMTSLGLPPFGLTHGLYVGGALPAQKDTHVTINRL